jgi:hypothetical protein
MPRLCTLQSSSTLFSFNAHVRASAHNDEGSIASNSATTCTSCARTERWIPRPSPTLFLPCSTRSGSAICPSSSSFSASCAGGVPFFVCLVVLTPHSRGLGHDRFGPYFVEPVICGLSGPDNKPFIAAMDLIGAPLLAKDSVVAGTCSEALYGMTESLWKPDLVRPQLLLAHRRRRHQTLTPLRAPRLNRNPMICSRPSLRFCFRPSTEMRSAVGVLLSTLCTHNVHFTS